MVIILFDTFIYILSVRFLSLLLQCCKWQPGNSHFFKKNCYDSHAKVTVAMPFSVNCTPTLKYLIY